MPRIGSLGRTSGRLRDVETLLLSAAPAVLTTDRADGTALASPVWFRYGDGVFDVVAAEGDVKLTHLARRPECAILPS